VKGTGQEFRLQGRVIKESPTGAGVDDPRFAASRRKKPNPNDADRVRKHLLRFGLSWQDVQTCSAAYLLA
jgi:sigma54-dependent transcription regulator